MSESQGGPHEGGVNPFWTVNNIIHYVFRAGMSFSERNKESSIHLGTKCLHIESHVT